MLCGGGGPSEERDILKVSLLGIMYMCVFVVCLFVWLVGFPFSSESLIYLRLPSNFLCSQQ